MSERPFCAEFRAARKAARLSQASVARRLGVSTVTVWNWEHGHSAPWPKDQESILARLDSVPEK